MDSGDGLGTRYCYEPRNGNQHVLLAPVPHYFTPAFAWILHPQLVLCRALYLRMNGTKLLGSELPMADGLAMTVSHQRSRPEVPPSIAGTHLTGHDDPWSPVGLPLGSSG